MNNDYLFNCMQEDYDDAFSEGVESFNENTDTQEFKKVKYYLRTSKFPLIPRQTIKYNDYRDIITGILIGEYNFGWCFALYVYPDQHIKTLNDWLQILNSLNVKNESIISLEYEGNGVNPREDSINIYSLKSMIKNNYDLREPPKELFNNSKNIFIKSLYRDYDDFLNRNNLMEGPKNLLRRKIDGRYCIDHGEGDFTFDYINGNF